MATIAELLEKDGTRKKIAINIYSQRKYIPDENIIFESFKLSESVCSQNEFKFGLAEQDVAEFQLVNYEKITGEYLEIWLRVYEGDSDSYIPSLIGYFRVKESKKDTNNTNIRKVIAMTDLDAPQGFMNSFSYLAETAKLKGYTEYLICPELMIYGGTKNRFSGSFEYATMRSRNQNVTLSQYIDATIHNFNVIARAWDNPVASSGNKAPYNTLYYIPPHKKPNYLDNSIISRINTEVDNLIRESGINPPESFNTKTKERIYNYLQRLQSFFGNDSNDHVYMYYIPTQAYNSRYESPFIDRFTMDFEGKTKEVYIFDNNPFIQMEIFNTKYDKVKDFVCLMNIEGLDMSTDDWIKQFRRDWYNLTGRICPNRLTVFPYAAAPTDLHQSALYPAERLYPAENLYPDGPAYSIFSENIKKLWVDDEEDLNRFKALKLAYVDHNRKTHIVTRIFHKTVSDIEIKATRYDLVGSNRVVMTLADSIQSNVIKIQAQYGIYCTLEFLDDNDNVVATALNSSAVYYKKVNGINVSYEKSSGYLSGTMVFESDDFVNVSKIKFIGTASLTVDNIRNSIKVFNEMHKEQDATGKTYVIDSSNMCLQRFKLDPGSIEYFADMLEGKLKNLNYIDVSMNSRGLPNMYAGDGLEIITKDNVYDTYIMRRQLSGIKVLDDYIVAN